MNHLVFISHSSIDNAIALQIYEQLDALGIKCWLDRVNLDGNAMEGTNYVRAIVQAIEHAAIFVSVLTDAAERSENVKNETDIAHQRRANGMLLCPFRLTSEDLAEEFRYYFARTNIVDGTVPPLEERIRSFCHEVRKAAEMIIKSEQTPIADQARLKLLDVDATTDEKKLASYLIETWKTPRMVGTLSQCARDLDLHYRSVIDPYKHYQYFNTYQITKADNCRLKVLTDTLYNMGHFSIALGDIFENVSYALINSGKIAYVQEARRFLSKALATYEHMMNTSPDNAPRLVESIILCQWLLSITHKIERNYGTSEQILLGLLRYAEEQREDMGLSYSKSVLLPRRELAIINEDYRAFDELISDIDLIEDPKERFYTYRRAFEFFCSENEEQKAAELKEPMIASYHRCSDDLYGVYYYAMQYNIYQFYSRFGHTEEAAQLYEKLLPELEENHFERYATKLKIAHGRILAGRKAKDYVK